MNRALGGASDTPETTPVLTEVLIEAWQSTTQQRTSQPWKGLPPRPDHEKYAQTVSCVWWEAHEKSSGFYRYLTIDDPAP